MYTALAQDWTTIRGGASTASVTQGENDWLDVLQFRDVVAWLEVREFTITGTLTVAYQTGPTKDDVLFMTAGSVAPVLGVQVTPMIKGAMPNSTPPCSRWLRWKLIATGGAAWDITFRLYFSMNRIGSDRLSHIETLGDLAEQNPYLFVTAPVPSGTQTAPTSPPKIPGGELISNLEPGQLGIGPYGEGIRPGAGNQTLPIVQLGNSLGNDGASVGTISRPQLVLPK